MATFFVKNFIAINFLKFNTLCSKFENNFISNKNWPVKYIY